MAGVFNAITYKRHLRQTVHFLPQLPFTYRKCLLNVLVCLLLCFFLPRTFVCFLVFPRTDLLCSELYRDLRQFRCIQVERRHTHTHTLSLSGISNPFLTCPSCLQKSLPQSLYLSPSWKREATFCQRVTAFSCNWRCVQIKQWVRGWLIVSQPALYLADMEAPALVCYPLLVLETHSRSCPPPPSSVWAVLR